MKTALAASMLLAEKRNILKHTQHQIFKTDCSDFTSVVLVVICTFFVTDA
jgi:hypothetical protein